MNFDLVTIPDCYPDTVRFRIPLSRGLFEYLQEGFTTDKHLMLKKSKGFSAPHEFPEGALRQEWEKGFIKYPSSFSDMVIMPSKLENVTKDSTGFLHRHFLQDSVDVEFSVHKWCYKSSCFNNGDLTFDYIWNPVDEALVFFGLSEKERFYCRRYAYLRRLDLSCNFTLDPRDSGLTVSDLVTTMLRFKFNRADYESKNGLCQYKAGQSLRWGNENSLYSVIFYDKAKEFEANWKEKKKRHIDVSDEETAFYHRFKEDVKNIFRFEVNFRTRWFNQGLEPVYEREGMERVKHPQGPEQIQKVIDLSAEKWGVLYRTAFGPLAKTNVSTMTNISLHQLKQKCAADRRHAVFLFADSCIYEGWKVVQSKTTKTLFYRYKKQLMDLYAWDITTAGPEVVECQIETEKEVERKPIKVVLRPQGNPECPIMYTTSTDLDPDIAILYPQQRRAM